MPLWFHDGRRYQTVNLSRADIGVDVFLCCPGPSLKKAVIARGQGALIAAITKAYPMVRPDIWFGMDVPACYDRRIWSESFMKICRGGVFSKGGPRIGDVLVELAGGEQRPLHSFPQVYFASLKKGAMADIFTRTGPDVKFVWEKDTLTTALHALRWMGARRIHLVGCDLGGDGDWCIDKVLSAEQRQAQAELFKQQLARLRQFAQMGPQHGVELISCTEGSPLNEHVPYVPLREALARSRAKLPVPGPIMHSREPAAASYMQPTLPPAVLRPSRDHVPAPVSRVLEDGTITWVPPLPCELEAAAPSKVPAEMTL